MSEDKLDLLMTWTRGPRPYRGGTVEKPVWVNVAEKIDRAFDAGGSVELNSVRWEVGSRGHEGWALVESITLTSEPRMFRLSVSPIASADPYPVLLHWWQPGPAEPRGTVRIWDDEWDSRMVCGDVRVAKTMFREFFDAKGITHYILDNAR